MRVAAHPILVLLLGDYDSHLLCRYLAKVQVWRHVGHLASVGVVPLVMEAFYTVDEPIWPTQHLQRRHG
jgi:hypothetical protein